MSFSKNLAAYSCLCGYIVPQPLPSPQEGIDLSFPGQEKKPSPFWGTAPIFLEEKYKKRTEKFHALGR
jgi:hypothetical protein